MQNLDSLFHLEAGDGQSWSAEQGDSGEQFRAVTVPESESFDGEPILIRTADTSPSHEARGHEV